MPGTQLGSGAYVGGLAVWVALAKLLGHPVVTLVLASLVHMRHARLRAKRATAQPSSQSQVRDRPGGSVLRAALQHRAARKSKACPARLRRLPLLPGLRG